MSKYYSLSSANLAMLSRTKRYVAMRDQMKKLWNEEEMSVIDAEISMM